MPYTHFSGWLCVSQRLVCHLLPLTMRIQFVESGHCGMGPQLSDTKHRANNVNESSGAKMQGKLRTDALLFSS